MAEEWGKWISVKEKLPELTLGRNGEEAEISDDVLVFFEGGDCQYEVANYDQDRDAWVLPNSGFTDADCAPTHWMPLPDPPKVWNSPTAELAVRGEGPKGKRVRKRNP